MSRVRGVMWTLGTPVRVLLIGAVRLYQLTLSGWMGGRCKYYPSCSRYAIEALRTHGALRGSALAVWRLLRCNPLSRGGVDHVPPARAAEVYDVISRGTGEGISSDRIEA